MQPVESHMSGSTCAARRGGEVVSHTVSLSAGTGTFSAAWSVLPGCLALVQVRQNTAMESHEEKLHKMIIQNKIAEVQEQMKVKAQAIDKARMEAQKAGRASAAYVPPSGGVPRNS